jgi:hypothetical protein
MLVYCDYIADRVRKALVAAKEDAFAPVPLNEVGKINWDLDSNGAFKSTKKTMVVEDGNGRKYVVTVEEIA